MVSKPSRDQGSMRVLVWEQQHLNVSSPADQRITHPGAEPTSLSVFLKEDGKLFPEFDTTGLGQTALCNILQYFANKSSVYTVFLEQCLQT